MVTWDDDGKVSVERSLVSFIWLEQLLARGTMGPTAQDCSIGHPTNIQLVRLDPEDTNVIFSMATLSYLEIFVDAAGGVSGTSEMYY